MFRQHGQGASPPELKSNLAPGSLADGSPVGATTAGNGIELRSHKCRNPGGRHCIDSRHLQQAGDAQPVLCLRSVVGQVIQQCERMRFAAAKLRCHVEDG